MNRISRSSVATALLVSLAVVGDQASAKFLSADPVKTNPNTGANFNRYSYASNNPFLFTDPDGRASVVKDGRVWIQPEDRSVPAVNLPNNVGAVGVSPTDDHFHTYNVTTSSALTGKQAGDGFKNNPTPGKDTPASPTGTRNDVGPIPTTDGTNIVRSYSVASPDPAKFSDITVNYTVAGEHGLTEGFVVRFGEIGANGSTTLRSYGEGNNWRQDPSLKDVPFVGWGAKGEAVWQQNQKEIIDAAQ